MVKETSSAETPQAIRSAVRRVISERPRMCYFGLVEVLKKTYGARDPANEMAGVDLPKEVKDLITQARPDCGWGCDDMCPVSGRPEKLHG